MPTCFGETAREGAMAIAPTLTPLPRAALGRGGLLGGLALSATRTCRPPFSSRSVITSVETSRMMIPSIMNVRYWTRVGSMLRWMLRSEVPVRSAPNNSAAATVPPAVFRPSSATAIP